jgi:hypothetical protein
VALIDVEGDPGPRATTTGSALLRRLVITCPVTGSATDAGFELSDLPAMVAGPQLLIDCLECRRTTHGASMMRCSTAS